MAKKKQKISDLINNIKDDINSSSEATEIPDIITFVENEDWLALPLHPTNPINLYPMQKIMLKTFYRGSIGNENITLSDQEIQMCLDAGLESPDKGDFIRKYESGELFRELVLVWGRRSGKDFITSIIAAYEAMKLLECPGGDPYAMYELSSANTINILTVANSSTQASIAFTEIRERILRSPYFNDKYMKDGITSTGVYLMTPKDKEMNKEAREKGGPITRGSVAIIVGHSNSDSLLGMGCIVLILDEVASYKTTGSSSSGDRIYAALTPTVQTYVKKIYETDENGDVVRDEYGQRIVKERRYDGKIISISSPRAKEGKFYELFRDAPNVSNRLSMRCPTWVINPTHTRESLRNDDNTLSETEFNMEFGAEFSGMGVEQFFLEDQLKVIFTGHDHQLSEMGKPGRVYFAHIDPATSSHNYALVIVHKEFYFNEQTKRTDYMLLVDHIKYWQPVKGPINPEEVTEYIVGLKRKFHIGMMTYDQWASQESILKLRKAGIPNKLTRFNNMYKMTIYKELENLVNSGRIIIPREEKSSLLYNEMIELQRRFTSGGFKVKFKEEGDGVKSDDVVDCLAGACYIAVEQQSNMLPSGKLVECGNPSGNDQVWKTMQGSVLGVGSGQQVARTLSNKSRLMSNIINNRR